MFELAGSSSQGSKRGFSEPRSPGAQEPWNLWFGARSPIISLTGVLFPFWPWIPEPSIFEILKKFDHLSTQIHYFLFTETRWSPVQPKLCRYSVVDLCHVIWAICKLAWVLRKIVLKLHLIFSAFRSVYRVVFLVNLERFWRYSVPKVSSL